MIHRVIEIPIYDSFYNVFVFIRREESLVSQEIHRAEHAAVLCDQNNSTKDCTLYVNHTIAGHSIGYIFLKRNLSSTLLVQPSKNREDLTIENDHQYLRYKEFNSDDAALFSLQKKLYMNSYHISFDLRYYPSYQGFEGSKSGASVFRPAVNESLRYANLTMISVQKHPVVSQITLVYKDLAVVTARLNFDSPLVEWDV